MADVVKIVDSIAASPTVRLDLNGEGSNGWYTRVFKAPPPRLRRSVSQNAMRDGAQVSSSQYDARVITLDLELIKTAQDDSATELQNLARELDRVDNFLMYQPQGASKPVFFRLFRSDFVDLEDVIAQDAMRRLTVELLAEPFALGLKETLGPYTVNNDPAAGSNGHFFDVSGVIGDVPAPCVLVDTSAVSAAAGVLAVRQHGAPSDTTPFFATQAESMTLGADTTNPGGGPDAAMSGSGANNFARTSFATFASMTDRLVATITLSDASGVAARGRYRALAVVRRSDATSEIKVRVGVSAGGSDVYQGPVTTVPLATNRRVLDLGPVAVGPAVRRVGGYSGVDIPIGTLIIYVYAERVSGTGTIDWDYVLMVPADEQMLIWEVLGTSTDELVIDSINESVYRTEGGTDPFAGSSSITGVNSAVSGGFPSLVPNQTNRFFLTGFGQGTATIAKTDTYTVTVDYWPRYLFARPSAS